MQASVDVLPFTELKVPSSHGFAVVEPLGQKCPAGQLVRLAAGVAQTLPAGHDGGDGRLQTSPGHEWPVVQGTGSRVAFAQ